MRFKLYEASKKGWPPSQKLIDEYNSLESLEQEISFIKNNILNQKKFEKLSALHNILLDNILQYGLDPNKNEFLKFVSEIPFKMQNESKYTAKVDYIKKSFMNGAINLKNKEFRTVLKDPSLYNRSDADFRYALGAFNIITTPSKLRSYIKDPSQVSIADFYIEDKIKPSGINKAKGDTIYNTIESWEDISYTKDEIIKNNLNSKNGDGKPSNKNNLYTLEDIIPKNQWNYDSLKQILEDAFDHSNNIEIEDSLENYLKKLYIAFEYPTKYNGSNIKNIAKTKNIIYVDNEKDIDAKTILKDASNFGDLKKQDEPIEIAIYLKNKDENSTSDETNTLDQDNKPIQYGICIFNEYMPLSDDSVEAELDRQSSNYKKDITTKTFEKDNDYKSKLGSYQGFIDILDQVGD